MWPEASPSLPRRRGSIGRSKGAARGGFYYLFDAAGQAVKKDSDMYQALDVLAQKMGIIEIFFDWLETVTVYANCMGLK